MTFAPEIADEIQYFLHTQLLFWLEFFESDQKSEHRVVNALINNPVEWGPLP